MTDRVLPAATGRLMAPGFGFHPTDEELISYLKRKVQGKPLVLDAIEEVDVYKQEDPSHLPEQSKLKTKDQEWFFFTTLEKYGLVGDIKRSTTKGYWHPIGADKEIKRRGDGEVIGKVKRLVFNRGRPPNNQPTNWVIHEYHLVDNDAHGLKTDAYVLCRVSHNSDSPSKNLSDLNDACLLPCVLNKEAPLPFIQYKRKRQGSDDDNASQAIHQESIPSVAAMVEVEDSEPESVDTMVVSTSLSWRRRRRRTATRDNALKERHNKENA